MMTAEDRSLLEALCAQIASETDNRRFGELVQQLINLLEQSRQNVKLVEHHPVSRVCPPKATPPNES